MTTAINELEFITQHICFRKDIGIHGNLFGGIMMCWIDEAGAIYSSRQANTTRIVTLKMEEVMFLNPVKEGDIIQIYGKVINIGRTSINIELKVLRHHPITGDKCDVCSTKMTFVKIDNHGKPSKIIK